MSILCRLLKTLQNCIQKSESIFIILGIGKNVYICIGIGGCVDVPIIDIVYGVEVVFAFDGDVIAVES